MLKAIIISVIVSVIISSLITILAMRITSNVFAKFLAQAEQRFDKKIKLKEMISSLHKNDV